jgi:hypothetical protein
VRVSVKNSGLKVFSDLAVLRHVEEVTGNVAMTCRPPSATSAATAGSSPATKCRST